MALFYAYFLLTSFPALIDTKTMWVFHSLEEFRGEYVEVEIFDTSVELLMMKRQKERMMS